MTRLWAVIFTVSTLVSNQPQLDSVIDPWAIASCLAMWCKVAPYRVYLSQTYPTYKISAAYVFTYIKATTRGLSLFRVLVVIDSYQGTYFTSHNT